MKRFFYIFAALLAMVSCSQKEELMPENTKGNQIVDGMLKVEFTVHDPSFKPASKAFGDNLDVDAMTMKVVVFDQHGVYLSQSDADLVKTGVGTGTYSAYFPVSDKDEMRIVHFLGNYSETIEYGTELEVISQLIVTDKVDGYWQRKEIANLKAREVNGDMTLEHGEDLDNIVLIRNFCKLTISAMAGSNLEISQAYIYNVPDAGSIAPYSSEKSGFVGSTKGGFITDYSSYTTTKKLIDAGYDACVPLNSNLIEHHNTDVLVNAEGTEIHLFSYEREMPLNDPPFIIVGGYFGKTPGDIAAAKTANRETYYKINLRDQDENYFPLLRNFDYKIAISEVRGEGSTSIDEALASPGSGDISTDVRFNSLTEISNGEAKMMVTETEVMLVSNAQHEIKFKFIPDITDLDANGNDISANGSEVTITLGDEGSTGAVFASESMIVKADSDDAQGWRTITFIPEEPGANPRKQSVEITGTYDDPTDDDPSDGTRQLTISRTITFLLREKPQLTASVRNAASTSSISELEATKETPFVLRVGVPAGLPSSIFPVELKIEASANSITPVDHLPVTSAKSTLDSRKPIIVYTKTVNFSEYTAAPHSNGEALFDIKFKTNKAASATDILVHHNLFQPTLTYFTNPGSPARGGRFDLVQIEQYEPENALLKFYVLSTGTPITIDLGPFATPSGKNVSEMHQVGSSTQYTFTPTEAGLQEIGLTLSDTKGCRFTLSADGFTTAHAERLSTKGYSFTGSDRTTNSSAVIPGFSTTLSLTKDAAGFTGDSGTVKFYIDGVGQDATWNPAQEKYQYTLDIPDNKYPGPIRVTATATENGITTTGDLGAINVWKQVVTVESNTRITEVSGLTARTLGWALDGSLHKVVWKGVMLRDQQYSGFMQNNNGTLRVRTTAQEETDKVASNPGYCFQTDGSTYLKTYAGSYLSITGNNAGNFTLVASDASTVSIVYSNNGLLFRRASSTGRRMQNNNGTLRVNNATESGTHRWNAYPVRVEYVAP